MSIRNVIDSGGNKKSKSIIIDPRLREPTAIPKSAGARKSYSGTYTIPKKSDFQSLFTPLDTSSREYQNDVEVHIKQSFYFEKSFGNFVIESCKLIHNNDLKEQFNIKKQDKELPESYAYIAVRNMEEANKIAKEGIKINNVPTSSLGDAKLAVCLQKHIDLSFETVPRKNQRYIIMMFKILKGKVKQIQPQRNSKMEPIPNFDCHVPVPHDKSKSSSDYYYLYRQSQYYLYEYDDDDEISPRPRQILPYAILEVKLLSELPIRIAQNFSLPSEPKVPENPAPPPLPPPPIPNKIENYVRGNVVWTGSLFSNKCNLGCVQLYSLFSLFRPTVMPGQITVSCVNPQANINLFVHNKRIYPNREFANSSFHSLYFFILPYKPSEYYDKFLKYLGSNNLTALGMINEGVDVLLIPPCQLAVNLGLKNESPYMLHCLFMCSNTFGDKFALKGNVIRNKISNACSIPTNNLRKALEETTKWCKAQLSEKSSVFPAPFASSSSPSYPLPPKPPGLSGENGLWLQGDGSPHYSSSDIDTSTLVKDPRLLKQKTYFQQVTSNVAPLNAAQGGSPSSDIVKTTDMVLSTTPERKVKRPLADIDEISSPNDLQEPPFKKLNTTTFIREMGTESETLRESKIPLLSTPPSETSNFISSQQTKIESEPKGYIAAGTPPLNLNSPAQSPNEVNSKHFQPTHLNHNAPKLLQTPPTSSPATHISKSEDTFKSDELPPDVYAELRSKLYQYTSGNCEMLETLQKATKQHLNNGNTLDESHLNNSPMHTQTEETQQNLLLPIPSSQPFTKTPGTIKSQVSINKEESFSVPSPNHRNVDDDNKDKLADILSQLLNDDTLKNLCKTTASTSSIGLTTLSSSIGQKYSNSLPLGLNIPENVFGKDPLKLDDKEPSSFTSYEELFQTHIADFNNELFLIEKNILQEFWNETNKLQKFPTAVNMNLEKLPINEEFSLNSNGQDLGLASLSSNLYHGGPQREILRNPDAPTNQEGHSPLQDSSHSTENSLSEDAGPRNKKFRAALTDFMKALRKNVES